MDRGASWATVHGVAKDQIRLRDSACTHTHTHTQTHSLDPGDEAVHTHTSSLDPGDAVARTTQALVGCRVLGLAIPSAYTFYSYSL